MTRSISFQNRICQDLEVTIANGATVSTPANLGGTSLAGLRVPAGFAGTTVRFQGSFDNVNFFDMKSGFSGNFIEAVIGSNAIYGLAQEDQIALAIINYIKIVAITPQTSDITIKLITRP